MDKAVLEQEVPATWKTDLLAGGVTTLLGLCISVLPHLIAWERTGRAAWFSDYDEFSVYALMAGQAYHNHPWHLADPVRAENAETYYSSFESVPGVVLARGLGLGPLGVNVTWRALGGIAAGLLWYVLLRSHVRSPLLAAGATALMLADAGMLAGQPIYAHAKLSLGIVLRHGDATEAPLRILPQWRVINPSLSLPWLLLYLCRLHAAVKAPARRRSCVAGLAFGILFYVYFYFWTTAGLGLLVAMLLDRAKWKTYFSIGSIGLFIGLPAFWQNYVFRQTYGADWMLRSDKFLPVGHFQELLLPRLTIPLLAVSLVWVMWRRRDLVYVAGIALAGFVLLNQQVITGLQIENFHWNLVMGPTLTMLILLLLVGLPHSRIKGFTFVTVALWGAIAAVTLSGLWLRVVESTRRGKPTEIAEQLNKYLAQRSCENAPRFLANAVVAGDRYFVEAASILDNTRPLDGYVVEVSGTVDNAEWDARVALNAYLCGLTRQEFEEEQIGWLDKTVWGPWARHRSKGAREERLRSRLASWDAMEADLSAALDRLGVRYLALPVLARADHLVPGWRCLQRGPDWQVWERGGD
jgi:hypothetical protein